MKDITLKPETLRTACATATIRMPSDCVELLKNRATEKGDALEIARTAGIMAAKNTPQILPFCHPVMTHHADITYEFHDDRVRVESEVSVIAPTGVEMEALTAATVAALCLYDMLKPHTDQKHMWLGEARLLKKRGGKSQYLSKQFIDAPRAVVIVLSDTIAAGKGKDRAGLAVRERLEAQDIDVVGFEIIPDEPDQLRERVQHWVDDGINLIITSGGTGIGPRDKTVETILPMITQEIPGMMEAARAFGQQRTPYAMMSRGVAGLIDRTLIATLPGSTNGAKESMAALMPALLHAFDAMTSQRHEDSPCN